LKAVLLLVRERHDRDIVIQISHPKPLGIGRASLYDGVPRVLQRGTITMARCFVAQPFDAGEFDKRYRQVYEPAIKAAGLEPYRVDRDPSASIVIDTIVSEIKSCSVFFVDITTDNPNVWFELGLAIAYGKRACIVCAATRSKFPFDIQHRHIIRYNTEAPGDFDDLKEKITARLNAIGEQQTTLDAVEKRLSQSAHLGTGLSDLEVLAMTVIVGEAKYLNNIAEISSIYNEMEAAGYLPVATSVALRGLFRSKFIVKQRVQDERGNEWDALAVTEEGWQWIEENLDRLLRGAPKKSPKSEPDDEIPF
jgi:hypothetical protein